MERKKFTIVHGREKILHEPNAHTLIMRTRRGADSSALQFQFRLDNERAPAMEKLLAQMQHFTLTLPFNFARWVVSHGVVQRSTLYDASLYDETGLSSA